MALMNETTNSEFIGTMRVFVMVLLWLLLNAIFVWIAYYSFFFMFEVHDFYGKGSTGILLLVGYGMYKVHKAYFKYVALLLESLSV